MTVLACLLCIGHANMHDADDTPSCGQKGQEHGHGHGVADAVAPETRNGNAQQEQLERSLQVRAHVYPDAATIVCDYYLQYTRPFFPFYLIASYFKKYYVY